MAPRSSAALLLLALAPLLLLAPRAAALDNGAPNSKRPPLGWSSWVALGEGWPGPDAKHPSFDFCDEASVRASVDAFHDVGLWQAGYRHFHLDDCWADLERNATGFLQVERDHFPNGMKPVVDYAHSKGLTFGLYTCAGTYTCVGKRPGSKDHWDQDAAVFAEWGVDVVKMDWCNTEGMVPEETYPKMAAALNRTGRRIHFNMCEWGRDDPWKWGPATAQSWRATGDHEGTWASTKSIIEQRTAIPAEHGGGPYAWNDMDMLESGNYKQAAHANGKEGNMTGVEYKTEFSMWAILASPMVVTTPLLNCSTGTCTPSITELQREILLNTEVIAINQDVTPAGRLLGPAGGMKEHGVKVFGRQLSGGMAAVALYNPEDAAAPGAVDFELLGWPSGATAAVRDLWAHKDLGVFRGRFPEEGRTLPVPAHATVVLRLTPSADEGAELLV
eukprot:CAMPEP_0115435974 /NCGR_PEP_ID=MMETSP0271-20121206/33941_1 /TAXON_ID=71861 /ORGANISM="Scrippsiella trochoidea, Strain CCMP3099" /LENGTH=444 /DNA_ID=CAMNT_0002861459 /DNA_START=1 /DNA_END=1335 /DNA_ORIENTATION=-